MLGAACTVPAVFVIALGHPSKGLAWAIGVLPAAVIGVLPRRKDRVRTLYVGVLFGAFIVLGSLLAQNEALAIAGMLLLPLAAALLAAVGLNYTDVHETLGIGLLPIAGSALAAAVTVLFWPEGEPRPRPRRELSSSSQALDYGIRLGLAAAVATGIGFAIHTDHVGWAAGATLFVMRPVADMQTLRSWGRVASVFLGALAGVTLLRYHPADYALALTTVAALAGAAATRGSRWYVTPFFTTFLVIQLLLAGSGSRRAGRPGSGPDQRPAA